MAIISPPEKKGDFDKEAQFKRVSDVIDHPDQFAEVFCTALKKQVEMREKIKELILELIKTDVAGRDEIKKLIQEINDADLRIFFKTVFGKIVVFIGAIIMILIGAYINSKF